MVSKLNSLLTSENERLQQLTEDLKQKHSHMTSEVNSFNFYLFFFLDCLKKNPYSHLSVSVSRPGSCHKQSRAAGHRTSSPHRGVAVGHGEDPPTREQTECSPE